MRRKRGRSQSAIEQSISTVLVEVQPMLRIEHCRLELVEFDTVTGLLVIRIEGNCPDCSVSPSIFATGIAAHVKQRIVEVSEVRIAR
ncbi:MAG TPA: NifU family protein [Gemmatimonadaceae bacterium]|nr:NifU family protein [Gemmatimonadaceae bacterium]